MIHRAALLAIALTATTASSNGPAGFIGPAAAQLVDTIPPPPVNGSAAAQADRTAYLEADHLVGSSDWERAIGDRAEAPEDMLARMRCATRRPIDSRTAPATLALLTRARIDLSYAVKVLKQRYNRPRPYAGDLHAQLCEPVPAEMRQQTSPSYPSGHASEAALTGYILASLLPAQSSTILQRARQYGEDRVVCRVHFPSDVQAGQALAAAMFAREQADARFRTDSTRARGELERIPTDPTTAPACDP